MALDGITTAALAAECRETLVGSYLAKIVQPEAEQLLLTWKTGSGPRRLLLSAQASLPLVYLTETNRSAPDTAPAFCMLLRKYIGGGKLTASEQPSLERVLIFHIDHRDELGDPRSWKLILELMGKHSNLILTDENDRILDAIKRIPASVSSVREVLPGRTWFLPNTREKADPFALDEAAWRSRLLSDPTPLHKSLVSALTGFSPLMAQELCSRARVDADLPAASCADGELTRLYNVLQNLLQEIRAGHFAPEWVLEGNIPFAYAALPLTQYAQQPRQTFSSVSGMLEAYYAEQEVRTRMRQKGASLRQQVQTLLERTARTLDLREKQYTDTEKRERFKLYGELLHTYGYQAEPGATYLDVQNYYTNEMLRIPLDPLLNAQQNATRYYTRYNKLKRTAEELETRIAESRVDLAYLDTVLSSLDTVRTEEDLTEIRQELSDGGYLRAPAAKKKKHSAAAAPLRYLSSDGFEMYVGKNNYQNEDVTFHIASSEDWFFHAKKIPGSHVIVKTGGKEVPDSTFEEAGRLAAYYSKGKLAPKVEVDYTLRKNVKKPPHARPGFVIYATNYSLLAEPDITGIRELPQ